MHNFSVTVEARIALSIDEKSGDDANARAQEFVEQVRHLAEKSGLLEMETPVITITDNDAPPKYRECGCCGGADYLDRHGRRI
jgi:lysyl-tRNA synthetase class II